ncbi:MAG: hypothetical protein V4559_13715 [Pseudomonadota bacterium]
MIKQLLSSSILLAATLSLCIAAQAEAIIDPKTWLTPDAPVGDLSSPIQVVPGLAVPKETRAEAVSLLISAKIVELNYEQAQHLLGTSPRDILGGRGTPYLVRAVNPNSGGSCDANMRNNVLFVFCGSLGEFIYELRPLVVFPGRKPSDVNISALTAR